MYQNGSQYQTPQMTIFSFFVLFFGNVLIFTTKDFSFFMCCFFIIYIFYIYHVLRLTQYSMINVFVGNVNIELPASTNQHAFDYGF